MKRIIVSIVLYLMSVLLFFSMAYHWFTNDHLTGVQLIKEMPYVFAGMLILYRAALTLPKTVKAKDILKH